MLEIIIVFAIYAGLQKLLDLPFENKIKEAKTTEEANKYRKHLKTARLLFFIVYLIGYFVFIFWLNFGVGEVNADTVPQSIKGIAMGLCMMYTYLVKQRKYKEFMGNVSTLEKDAYLKENEHFALFLRGFAEDDYSKEKDLAKPEESGHFSEYKFMSLLQTKIPACAIGMTKESDSPYGAARIYVNDASWKEDVKEMMEKADEIYILVNDRISCIWEIEQSAPLLKKTTFIIDDRQKYERVRNSLQEAGLTFLPDIPGPYQASAHLFLRNAGDAPVFEEYANTLESYSALLQIPIPETEKKGIMNPKWQKGCLIAMVVLIVFVIVVVVINSL